MSEIKVLDKQIADKIAAGEVIERPLSIVKELVENSLDSGAKSISVEIRKGGKEYIRVTDDGCGIPAEEAERAFLRHATSKISKLSDLDAIESLGFRGEALASIAAVTHTELVTKCGGVKLGVKLLISGGQVISNQSTGCPDGTTFIVTDLFYNTPARRKFMKSDSAECSLIIEFVSEMALAYSNVRFRLINNGKILFSTTGDGDRPAVIQRVFGDVNCKNLVPIDYTSEDGQISVSGYTSTPAMSKTTRSSQIFFVNGRVINSKVLERAVSAAYKERLFEGRFPVTYLFLDTAPDTLDVNIHPNKREVRFDDERMIGEVVTEAVRTAITTEDAVVDASTLGKFNKILRDDTQAYQMSILDGEAAVLREGGTDISSKYECSEDALRSQNMNEHGGADEFEPGIEKGEAGKDDAKNDGDNSSDKIKGNDKGKEETKDEVDIKSLLLLVENLEKRQTYTFTPDIVPDIDEDDASGDDSSSEDLGSSSGKALLGRNKKNAEHGNPDDENGSNLLYLDVASKSRHSESADEVNEELKLEVELGDIMEDGTESKYKNDGSIHIDIAYNKPFDFDKLKVIGCIFDTYILATEKDNFYLIDQHAAHERIFYEKLVGEYNSKEKDGQTLMIPLIINVSLAVSEEKGSWLSALESMGFAMEEFGPSTFRITEIPVFMELSEAEDFANSFIDSAKSTTDFSNTVVVNKLIMTSCKSAIKANDRLSPEEIAALMHQLSGCKNPFSCPHGRPTFIKLGKYDIERMFKRA